MDPEWDGPLFVLRYVGAKGTQMVAECVGRDTFGERIIRFLVVSNYRVYRPEDVISWEIGRCRVLRGYPRADMPQRFVRRAQFVDCLPVPGPLFPIPIYPEDIDDTMDFVLDEPEDFAEYPVDLPPFPSLASRFFSYFSFTSLF